MPPIEQLGLPSKFYKPGRKANHEDYTVKSIIDSSFTESFTSIQKTFGVELERVADLVVGNTHEESYYTIDGINYFPLLHQLVSSEMDCDRMDYLLRDSYFCGVSYGKFDLDWIIDNLSACTIEGKAYLGLSERAVATFDDFLLCRFHMFLMVYFHYKAVALEKLLKRYFESAPSEYKIPANIEEYLNHDDHYLMKVLRNSENIWAKRIVRNNIPRKIFETFGQSQHAQLARLEQYLTANNIDFIKCSSSGRLSKYYQNSSAIIKYPLKVIRESNIASASVQYMDINQATDLFDKFSKAHSVDRIHCDFDELDSLHQNEIIKIITTQWI